MALTSPTLAQAAVGPAAIVKPITSVAAFVNRRRPPRPRTAPPRSL
jgi:hypothetical protein